LSIAGISVSSALRDRDLIARGRRQRELGEPVTPGRCEQIQIAAARQAVVIEHGADPLLPLAALIHQAVAQPDLGTEIEDVIGRDPALRQPPGHQQLA
jgi:hypothetical protein